MKKIIALFQVIALLAVSCSKNDNEDIELNREEEETPVQEVLCDCLLKEIYGSDGSKVYSYDISTADWKVTGSRPENANYSFEFEFEKDTLRRTKRHEYGQLYSYSEITYSPETSLPQKKENYYASGEKYLTTEYYYDQNGFLFQKIGYNANSEVRSISEYLEIDQDGNPLLEFRKNSFDATTGLMLRYAYDDGTWIYRDNPHSFAESQKNNIIWSSFTNSSPGADPNWNPQAFVRYEYDECGFAARKYRINEDGSESLLTRFVYKCR